jgi:hypothetical protein
MSIRVIYHAMSQTTVFMHCKQIMLKIIFSVAIFFANFIFYFIL